MNREYRWRSKNGKAFFHAGFGRQDAVGTPHPGHDFPLQEGVRLIFAKGVDRIWYFILASVFLRIISRPLRRNRRNKRKGA